MTPLPSGVPGAPAQSALIVWRLDAAAHAATWDTGEGAFRVGGRWSSTGRRVIYTAIDPATAILEVAVHKGFDALDTVAHKLLSIKIHEPERVHVLDRQTITNPHWLSPGVPSKNQQQRGDELLAKHPFLIVPSVVSQHSWNLLINVTTAKGLFELEHMEDFALDTRLAKPELP